MEFFKKIRDSIYNFFGLAKSKVKEIESKIDAKIEEVEEVVKNQSEKITDVSPLPLSLVNTFEDKVEEVFKKVKAKSNSVKPVKKTTPKGKK